MLVLRCTQRLARRLGVEPQVDVPTSTTRLGDLYANLVHVGRTQLVLGVSAQTLLPTVIAAAPGNTIPARLGAAMCDLLVALGVTPVTAVAEREAMRHVLYGKTASRQVLGIMTDFAKALPYLMDCGSLLSVSSELARTPLSPLYKTSISADRATIALFAS